MKTKTSKKAKPNRLFTDEESEFFETSFGDRKVSHVNQSRMIAIPKLALENLCNSTDGLTMAISLVAEKGKEKFLKLIPIDDEDIDEDSQDEDDDDDEEED
jgi:hypothetical protein